MKKTTTIKKIKFLPIIAILTTSLCIVCDPEEGSGDADQTVETKSVTIDASAFSGWKYFSFETDKEISADEVGDYESSKTKTNLKIQCWVYGTTAKACPQCCG